MEASRRPNVPSLAERAYRIRRNALRMGEVQGQGYIAQALGVADRAGGRLFPRNALSRRRSRNGKAATGSCCRSAITRSRCTRP